MACASIPPKKKFIFRVCMLTAFIISYAVGAMSTMHNNRHATIGFSVVAVVLSFFLLMIYRVGYKSLNEQVSEVVEAQSAAAAAAAISARTFNVNTATHLYANAAKGGTDVISMEGPAGTTDSSVTSVEGIDAHTLRTTAVLEIPKVCFFRRNCELVMTISFVAFCISLGVSFTYMYYAIANRQSYTMTSYWMAFMSFLMSGKWCFMGWFTGRKYRNERDVFMAEHGVVEHLV